VPRFLTESYLAAGKVSSLVEAANRLDAATASQPGVHRLATVYMPTDETCLYLFDADTPEQIAAACASADVTIDRISLAVYIGGQSHDPVDQPYQDFSLASPEKSTR
jgi:hypothetical protein